MHVISRSSARVVLELLIVHQSKPKVYFVYIIILIDADLIMLILITFLLVIASVSKKDIDLNFRRDCPFILYSYW